MTVPALVLEYLQVPDWDHLQHYKDRAPIWIKSYPDTLDNYQFAALPDVTKGHLFAIQLLASRNDNKLPRDARWIGQRIGAHEPVDLDALVSAGFLEPYDPDSNPLADRKHVAPREEKRRVEKKREDARAREAPGVKKPPAPPRGGNPVSVQTLIPLLQVEDGGEQADVDDGPGHQEYLAKMAELAKPQSRAAGDSA